MSQEVGQNILKCSISETQFKERLEGSEYDATQKQGLLSIFNLISGGDSDLSTNDWNKFINESDEDGDGVLNEGEIEESTGRSDKLICSMCKDYVVKFYNIIMDFINSPSNVGTSANEESVREAEEASEAGSIEYCPPKVNKLRKTSKKTKGTFDYKWIEKDAYGSKTYEEWLKNNGYEVNKDAADKLMKEASKKCAPGWCAKVNRECMQDTTAVSPDEYAILSKKKDSDESGKSKKLFKSDKLFNNMTSQDYAYQYGSEMADNPYFKEVPHNIIVSMTKEELSDLPEGAVFVYDAGYKIDTDKKGRVTDYHRKGHFGIKGIGDNEYGGESKSIHIQSGKKDTHIRVFIPIKIKVNNDEELS